MLKAESAVEAIAPAVKYDVISVSKCETPTGMSGDDWYRYEIGMGTSKIIGHKPGTLNDVTEHARLMAEELNARATRNGSIYMPRIRSTRNNITPVKTPHS